MLGDIILGVALIFAVMWGWHKGFLRVLGGVGGLFLAFILARKLSAVLVPYLIQLLPESETTVSATSAWQILLKQLFYSSSVPGHVAELVLALVLFALIYFVIHFLVGLISRVLNLTALGFFNRILGAGAGFFVIALLISAFSLWLLPAFAEGKTSGFWLLLSQIFATSSYVLPLAEKIGVWALTIVSNPPQLPDLTLPSVENISPEMGQNV